MKEYDIIIIGGGMVGSSLACALAESTARVAVIEAVPMQAPAQSSFDDRGLALSLSSRKILEAIGIWPDISRHVCPIHAVHVSDRGHFGFMRLHARDFNMEALGYVAVARELGKALMAGMSRHKNIDFICPATTTTINIESECVSLILESEGINKILNCKLLVAADGARSSTCMKLDIPVRSKDYGQTAIVANVTSEKIHNYTAYERFTDSGPLALLPLTDQHCKMVFTVSTQETQKYLDLTDSEFLEQLQLRFGRRLGRFTRIGNRSSYPLLLHEAEEQVRDRVLLAGNSAHTIHPHGAQGLNLSLRDIAALSSRLLPVLENGGDPGNLNLLEQYVADRHQDQRRIIGFSDGLATLFYDQHPFKVLARNTGMVMMDLFPVLKRKLLFLTLGVKGRLPVSA